MERLAIMEVYICRFCQLEVGEEGLIVDMYSCDSCQSYVCYECVWTSVKTGKDYCSYCKANGEAK
jgi:hypothetical protein